MRVTYTNVHIFHRFSFYDYCISLVTKTISVNKIGLLFVVFKKVISWFGKDSDNKESASKHRETKKNNNDSSDVKSKDTQFKGNKAKGSNRKPRSKKHDKNNDSNRPRTNEVFEPVSEKATVIPRGDHPISRKQISPSALKVLYRLKDNGYQAYLVGGCIRDILLGLEPKDFDVVTNATPEQVKACFSNCRLIGRRFRLAHIMFGREIIEVATMRGHHSFDEETASDEPSTDEIGDNNTTSVSNSTTKKISKQSDEGQLLRDNVYGTIDEDAERRDFTINSLYYDIRNFDLLDFANGMADIEAGVIDLIGDPETRYREDPVRMLRAVRFSTKLRMKIAERTETPIFELGHLLRNIPPARLFDESLKLFLSGKALDNFESLRHYGLFKYFFPAAEQVLTGNPEDKEERMMKLMFTNTDIRINAEKSISPAFVLAAIYWYPLEAHAEELQHESGLSPYDAFQLAMNDVLHRAVQSIAIPKRFTATMRDIWNSQHRLLKTQGKRPLQMLENARFRAAYDFLLLRAEIEGGELEEVADFWTELQESDDAQRIMAEAKRNASKRRFEDRKPSSRGKKPGPKDGESKPKRSGKYRSQRRRKKPSGDKS